MISDRLYELAFAYRKTKLWEVLWDTEMFGVKLPDGRTGFVSIMGAAGRHCALGVYIGTRGLDSFRIMSKADQFQMEVFEFQEQLMQQECLQCSFEGKDDMSEEEREEVRAFARSRGIRLAGKNAYPRFTKYQPNLCPWHLETEEEQEILCAALAAAIALSGLLAGKTPGGMGFREIDSGETEIPMLEQKEGTWVLTKTKTPAERPRRLPMPRAANEIGIAKLKKLKKTGAWECGIIRLPDPVRDGTKDEIPFFPVVLLAVNSATGYILPLPFVKDYEEHPEELLDFFIEGLLQQKICPGEILVRDERTCRFMEAFCDRLKIRLEKVEELEALEEAERLVLERLDMDEEEELEEFFGAVDMLLDMTEEQLKGLPREVADQFQMLMEHGIFPEDMEERLKKVLELTGGKTDGGGREGKIQPADNITKMTPAQSYVISVSLGRGCYRHIQIAGNRTLLDLHRAIQDAFAFHDDHLHAFFMDNHSWSARDSYYAEGAEGEKRHTGKCRLSQLDLQKGRQFKYIFDFGDEWTFQCRVLKILEGHVPETAVVRSKGEAPDQYGAWEDDWDDE